MMELHLRQRDAIILRYGRETVVLVGSFRGYSRDMVTTHAVLDELLDPVSRCLTLEVAHRLTQLRAPESAQRRMQEFAARSSEGTLSAQEREECEAYVSAGTLIAVLQSKARKLLRDTQGT